MPPKLRVFRFWCQKVLPLVYDDSLSYYEVLCKVIEYLNNMINNVNEISDDVVQLQTEMQEVQKWINDFDTSFAEQIIKDYLATMIFVGISDSGYIVYWIPENWQAITFNTTGLDIEVPIQPQYGHLVLSY